MGREIRMVPPNWEHPRYTRDNARYSNHIGSFIPLHDSSFKQAAAEWKEGFAAWERGERPDYASDDSKALEYWEWEVMPPERDSYRPDWPEGSATWFQVYETVSEGTPITPPFATKAELINWLCTHKDYWDKGPLTREQAAAFVKDEYAPSLMVSTGPGGFKIAEGMEIAAAFPRETEGHK